MATGPVWSENNTTISSQLITSGNTVFGDIDLANNNWDATSIQFNLTDSGSASITVNIYSSPDSGTTTDTVSLPGGFETDGSGTQTIRTVTVLGHPYVRVELVNNDGSNLTGTVEVLHAGRQWSSSV